MRTSSSRDRRVRDWGLHQVSSGTRWIAAAAVVATGAISASFALPQLLDKAQAQPDPSSTSGTPSASFGAPPTTTPESQSSPSSSLELPSVPPAAPAPRHRSHAVTGGS
jgi:hypothetical protein